MAGPEYVIQTHVEVFADPVLESKQDTADTLDRGIAAVCLPIAAGGCSPALGRGAGELQLAGLHPKLLLARQRLLLAGGEEVLVAGGG